MPKPQPQLKADLLAYQAGDPQAGNRIVASQGGLVGSVVKRYRSVYPGDIEDLRQAGMIGLTRAAQRFDATRGTIWSSYAWTWIRKYILIEIRDTRKFTDKWDGEAEPKPSDEDILGQSPLEESLGREKTYRLNQGLTTLDLGSELRIRAKGRIPFKGQIPFTNQTREKKSAELSALIALFS